MRCNEKSTSHIYLEVLTYIGFRVNVEGTGYIFVYIYMKITTIITQNDVDIKMLSRFPHLLYFKTFTESY